MKLNWSKLKTKLYRFLHWLVTKVFYRQAAKAIWEIVQVADEQKDLTTGAQKLEFTVELVRQRFPELSRSILNSVIESAVGKLKNVS